MADSKEYYTQKAENGSIQISEDVVASVAAPLPPWQCSSRRASAV